MRNCSLIIITISVRYGPVLAPTAFKVAADGTGPTVSGFGVEMVQGLLFDRVECDGCRTGIIEQYNVPPVFLLTRQIPVPRAAACICVDRAGGTVLIISFHRIMLLSCLAPLSYQFMLTDATINSLVLIFTHRCAASTHLCLMTSTAPWVFSSGLIPTFAVLSISALQIIYSSRSAKQSNVCLT